MQTNEHEKLIGLDDSDFGRTLEAHRRELHVHCYRMTGSFTDAEDLVQETFVRAWQARREFEGRSTHRTWLYRIATNVCLDVRKRRDRHTVPTTLSDDPLESTTVIQPYPDSLLFGSPPQNPADTAVAKETVGLVFIAALTRLPPRQRAALIARDVLEFTTAEAAQILDASETSINSLLQRARATMRAHISDTVQPTTSPDVRGEIVRRYIEAHERGDVRAIVVLLRDDIRITMPPGTSRTGLDETTAFFAEIFGPHRPGDWRLIPIKANGQPAVANYLRRSDESLYRAFSIDVLDVIDGRLRTINCFLDTETFPFFGLEMTLPTKH